MRGMAKPGQFNMMAVLRVDQDSDMEMLLSLQEDVSRLTRKSWRSRAIFVNVVSSHSRSDRSTQHSDELMEEWLQVAQMLSQAKQPVVGIALHPVYLPGILVLDACDFVIATTDHKGTHIDRVFAEDQLNDYVHLLLHEVAGIWWLIRFFPFDAETTETSSSSAEDPGTASNSINTGSHDVPVQQ